MNFKNKIESEVKMMSDRKKISVVIPTYNEELNVEIAYDVVTKILKTFISKYNYEILFIDNCSNDKTKDLITKICDKDKNVKAIFNAKNFGWQRSFFYGLTQSTGDCAILLSCDLQEPPSLIYDFVKEWENGYKIICGIKSQSKENKLIRFCRTCYYKLIKKLSDTEQIEHYMGFGLYDKSFISVIRELDDPIPYFRGIVAELGFNRKDIYYMQDRRKFGKSHFNFLQLYDLAMQGITSYTKIGLRIASMMGFIISFFCFLVTLVTFIIKIFNWQYYDIGLAMVIEGIFFLGGIQLFFIGLIGEYILSINTRIMKRPLVIEEKRINFD